MEEDTQTWILKDNEIGNILDDLFNKYKTMYREHFTEKKSQKEKKDIGYTFLRTYFQELRDRQKNNAQDSDLNSEGSYNSSEEDSTLVLPL